MKNKTQAFSPGCDLWILLDDSNSYWWKEINFNSAFLLSTLADHKMNRFTHALSSEAEHILKQTEFPKYNFQSNSKMIFLATQNHFLNRWLCLIEKYQDLESVDFLNNIKNLKCNNIRFFFDAQAPAGLKSSFPNAEFISGSH